MKWLRSPVKILGVYVSYDESGNKQMNFNLKLRKLQTNLDMWKASDLTLFGRALIIKSLGLSQLVYSASNLNVPQEITPIIKTKLFNFLWKNKRDKIKGAGLYLACVAERQNCRYSPSEQRLPKACCDI